MKRNRGPEVLNGDEQSFRVEMKNRNSADIEDNDDRKMATWWFEKLAECP